MYTLVSVCIHYWFKQVLLVNEAKMLLKSYFQGSMPLNLPRYRWVYLHIYLLPSLPHFNYVALL